MGRSCSVAWKAEVRWTVSAVAFFERRAGTRLRLADFDFAEVLPLADDFDVVCALDFFDVEDFLEVEVLEDLCEVDCGSPGDPHPEELVSRKPSSTTV
jgi:hypothetical protein